MVIDNRRISNSKCQKWALFRLHMLGSYQGRNSDAVFTRDWTATKWAGETAEPMSVRGDYWFNLFRGRRAWNSRGRIPKKENSVAFDSNICLDTLIHCAVNIKTMAAMYASLPTLQ